MKKFFTAMKLKTVLCGTLLALCSVAAKADYWTPSNFSFKDIGGGAAAITDYKGAGGAITIPGTATFTDTDINGKIIDVKYYTVTTIEGYAFFGLSRPMSVTVGASVTTIEDDAFSGCHGLTSVIIGNSVTTIGDNAFRDCENLTSVIIGSSVTTIGNNAFYGCNNLTDVTVKWTTPLSIGGYEFFYDADLSSRTLHVPVGTMAQYRETDGWKDFGTITEQGSGQANIRVESAEIVYAGGALSVNTPRGEVVEIYSVSGLLLYRARKDAGQAAFDLRHLPGGILIARGSSGWVKKIVVRR
ncbi:MAG: leucine-rich repeat domain-containing protein [Tannerella sp.]|nr:leucine-rich repeat domain-containing protein [Tannerella sp.]